MIWVVCSKFTGMTSFPNTRMLWSFERAHHRRVEDSLRYDISRSNPTRLSLEVEWDTFRSTAATPRQRTTAGLNYAPRCKGCETALHMYNGGSASSTIGKKTHNGGEICEKHVFLRSPVC